MCRATTSSRRSAAFAALLLALPRRAGRGPAGAWRSAAARSSRRTTGGTSTSARRRSTRAAHRSSSSSAPTRGAPPRLRGRRRRGPAGDLRDGLHDRPRRPAARAGGVRLRRRERRRARRAGPPAIRFPSRRRPRRSGSRGATPGTPTSAATSTCSSSTATTGSSSRPGTRAAFPPARRPARGRPAPGRSSSSTRTSAGPTTWTSADAAGLAILPGLVRYDEAFGTSPIRHAFRVTARATNGYVYPASHEAGTTARRPADGDPPPPEGVEGHLGLPGVRPADLPGDEDLRPHRGRQRVRHVRPGGLRHPLGQRRPQPGVREPQGRRLRGHPAGMEACRGDARPRRRASTP